MSRGRRNATGILQKTMLQTLFLIIWSRPNTMARDVLSTPKERFHGKRGRSGALNWGTNRLGLESQLCWIRASGARQSKGQFMNSETDKKWRDDCEMVMKALHDRVSAPEDAVIAQQKIMEALATDALTPPQIIRPHLRS
jgi:hypothetical protein